MFEEQQVDEEDELQEIMEQPMEEDSGEGDSDDEILEGEDGTV